MLLTPQPPSLLLLRSHAQPLPILICCSCALERAWHAGKEAHHSWVRCAASSPCYCLCFPPTLTYKWEKQDKDKNKGGQRTKPVCWCQGPSDRGVGFLYLQDVREKDWAMGWEKGKIWTQVNVASQYCTQENTGNCYFISASLLNTYQVNGVTARVFHNTWNTLFKPVTPKKLKRDFCSTCHKPPKDWKSLPTVHTTHLNVSYSFKVQLRTDFN